MNTTLVESRARPNDAAAYGGLIDAIGGIATAVIAIVALAGFAPDVLAGICTIVFGAALLIEGGTLLSEYVQISSTEATSEEQLTGGGLSAMFLFGIGGIVLGVLALLGIAPAALISVAVIAYGSTLLLSSSSVRQLYLLQSATMRTAGIRSGSELMAGGMASGSAGVQLLAGLAAIVLGILAVSGSHTLLLTLVALLVLGVTELLTGSALSALVLSFMRPVRPGTAREVR